MMKLRSKALKISLTKKVWIPLKEMRKWSLLKNSLKDLRIRHLSNLSWYLAADKELININQINVRTFNEENSLCNWLEHWRRHLYTKEDRDFVRLKGIYKACKNYLYPCSKSHLETYTIWMKMMIRKTQVPWKAKMTSNKST